MASHAPTAPDGPVPKSHKPLPCGGFKRSLMKPTRASALLAHFLDYPWHARLFGLLRWAAPIFRVPLTNVFVVTRYDDVLEVLSRDQDFPVPWAGKMKGLTDGENFVLGMPRDAKYKLSYEQLARVFPRQDVGTIIRPQAARISKDRVDKLASAKKKEDKDVIQKLMWAVPTELTGKYYGIPLSSPEEFAFCTVAASGYVFGPPSEKSDPQALAAAGCLRDAIHHGLKQAKEGKNDGTVMARLVEEQRRNRNVTDEVITAQLFGMVLGFIPTNLIASGNIIDTLLRFPAFMEQARKAADDDDDQRLWLCLQEALRFRFINPGSWRICARASALAAGTSRATVIPAGASVLASMQSAMFDPQKIKLPHKFNPNRPAEDYLTFSYGQHWCVGAYIAMAQITETFKALLTRPGLRRADGPDGTLRRITIYPAFMQVEFA